MSPGRTHIAKLTLASTLACATILAGLALGTATTATATTATAAISPPAPTATLCEPTFTRPPTLPRHIPTAEQRPQAGITTERRPIGIPTQGQLDPISLEILNRLGLHQQLCAIDTRFIHSPYYWRLGIPDLGQDIGAYKAAELIRSGRGVILLTKVGGNDTHRERDMRKLDHQVEYLAVRVYSFRDLWRANAAQGLTAVNTDSSLTFIEREHLATLRRFEGRAACGFSTAWPAIHKLLKAYPPVGVRISAYEALRELQAHRQVVLINRDGLDVTVDNLRALRGLGAGNTD